LLLRFKLKYSFISIGIREIASDNDMLYANAHFETLSVSVPVQKFFESRINRQLKR